MYMDPEFLTLIKGRLHYSEQSCRIVPYSSGVKVGINFAQL